MRLFQRIESQAPNFTEGEKALAALLIDRYPNIGFETTTAIGRAASVSAATVVRFFTKLGYGGFAEFQREARDEVSTRLQSPLQRLETPGGAEPAGLIDQTIALDIANISATLRGLDRGKLDELIDRLCRPGQRVFICGEKKAYAVAHYLYTQLNPCVDDVVLIESGQSLIGDRLLRLRSDDLLIAIDVRRYIRNVELTAKAFRDIGADIAILSDSALSPLTRFARYRIGVATDGVSAFDSYTSLFSAANLICNGVAAKSRHQVAKNLAVGEKLWESFGIFSVESERTGRKRK